MSDPQPGGTDLDLSQFEIFRGLTPEQLEALREHSGYWDVHEEGHIFSEGDPAEVLFIVIKGQIEIYRKTLDGDVTMTMLGPGEVFGEMGLIIDTGQRTTSARAKEPTTLFEIRRNPIDVSKQVADPIATIFLLKNLLCILGRRLREKDKPSAVVVKGIVPFAEGFEPDPQAALKSLEEALPDDAKSVHRELKAGEFLCHEGDAADGFYIFHSGRLEILKEPTGEEPRTLVQITPPTIAGELGFFSDENRSAGIRAVTDVAYTHIAGADFLRLEKDDPEKAMNVLFAATQMAVHMIVQRENL